MTIREMAEQREVAYFSPYASLSSKSRGRDREEPPCDIRPVYQRDRDRVLHSKAFRRLKHKTQVFLLPQGDHYRTRLTHTLEVAQTARTIARALRMNEDLAEAIALGHDLGHTPFGHAGEQALNEICPFGFAHFEQSVRVVDVPAEYREVLGDTIRERLNALIHDIVIHSQGKDDIVMSPEMEKAMRGMRNFLFENVYHNPLAKREEKKVRHLLQELYQYYIEHPLELSEEYLNLMDAGQEKERVVCDYIAGMTDQYAMQAFADLYIPKAWPVK